MDSVTHDTLDTTGQFMRKEQYRIASDLKKTTMHGWVFLNK